MNVWASVITAVIGASLGATLAYWLQRARPIVIIDSIRLTVERSSDKVRTRVSRSLEQALKAYERELGFSSSSGKGAIETEQDYVTALTRAQSALEDEIETALPRLKDMARKLREDVISDDYESMDRHFARDSSVLWEPLATAIVRGQFSFPMVSPGDKARGFLQKPKEDTKFHDTEELSNEVVIDMPGPYRVALGFINASGVKDSKLESAGKRLANAIKYRNRSDLLIAIQGIRTIAEDRLVRVKELADKVAQELEPHKRFVIEGTVANSGRTSFSVSNLCKMVIAMKGYPSSGGTDELQDDVEILLDLGVPSAAKALEVYVNTDKETYSGVQGEKGIDYSTPLLVQSGQSQRFTCVSNTATSLPLSVELLQAFKGGNEDCYIALSSIRNRRRQFAVMYSRRVKFRDLARAADLPRQPSRKRIGRNR